MAKLGIVVLIVIAWLGIYLGRVAGVGVASFRRGYNEVQGAVEQVSVEELITRWCITAHTIGQDARAAAEMSAARRFTEEEWANRRGVWERVFDAVKRDRESCLPQTTPTAEGPADGAVAAAAAGPPAVERAVPEPKLTLAGLEDLADKLKEARARLEGRRMHRCR